MPFLVWGPSSKYDQPTNPRFIAETTGLMIDPNATQSLSSIPVDLIGIVALYVVLLFFPGALLSSILRITEHRFLISYGISLGIIAISHVAIQALGGTYKEWFYCLGLLYISIVLIWIVSWTNGIRRRETNPLAISRRTTAETLNRPGVETIGFLSLVLIFGTYHISVGPYTEIPSDFWEHLSRSESQLIALKNTLGNQTLEIDHLKVTLYSNVVYCIHSVIALLTSNSTLEASLAGTLSTGILFLGSVYWFSLALLKDTSLTPLARSLAGLLVAFFTVTAFGTTTFSFIRYYGYFPTAFCFPLVFLAVLLFLEFQENPLGRFKSGLAVAGIMSVLSVIHLQEALFVLVLTSGLIVWRAVSSALAPGWYSQSNLRDNYLVLACWLLALPIIVILILRYGTIQPWGYTPHTVSLPDWIPTIGGLPVANAQFRFWDTLGFFGVIAYIIYFSNWGLFKRSGYVFVGMVSPIFTHFNPGYVYLFLHLNSSTTVWRTAYLMPLAFVVAVFLVHKTACVFRTRNLTQILVLAISVALITSSLIPFTVGNHVNRVSRFPSIYSDETRSGRLLWHDLISEVRRINNTQAVKGIITDHVTKFVLDAAVFGVIPNRQARDYFPHHNKTFATDLIFSDLSNYLLVVNKRNGAITESALYSGHWPPDILLTTQLYPKNIESFLEGHVKRFNLLWDENSIKIYQILPH